MLIYLFAEHYPNPYKPQFDTEFAFFLRNGHEIQIFASGQFTSTIHPRVRKYGLDKMTSLFPTTLKTVPKFFAAILFRIIKSPYVSLKKTILIYDQKLSVKKNIMRIARMMVLPEASPDFCYIHNIATAESMDFLHLLYPDSRVIMYFHGGEVGGVQRVIRDSQLFKLMHVVFSNTDFSRNQAIDRGCPPERAIVLPVGFDLDDYPSDAHKMYRVGGVLRLISVGRLSIEKGLEFPLKAISDLVTKGYRKINYTIIGCGNQEKYLREIVRNNHLEEYVTFVGEQDKEGVVSYLQQSDVLILPSIVTDTWAETQAAVVQEAMFMRLLVITTIAGGVPESTADVMKQFSVPVCDAAAISNKILEILALPESEMTQLGEAARSFTVEKYDINKIGVKLLDMAMGSR